MKIIPLSEGSFTIDHTKVFVPFNDQEDQLQERPRGSLLVEIQPFLLIFKDDIILLDGGLGFTDTHGVLQIHNNLAQHGIYPSDITKVLMSHLHKDHSGGIVMKDPLRGEYQLAFPQATYYIQKRELDYALGKGSASFDVEGLTPLIGHEQVVFLDADAGEIVDGIRYELSGGHSPFHQVFYFQDGSEMVFYGGDEAPQLQQMRTRFVAKYDNDGKKAMMLRQHWWEIGQQQKWTFLFYHDIKTPQFTAHE